MVEGHTFRWNSKPKDVAIPAHPSVRWSVSGAGRPDASAGPQGKTPTLRGVGAVPHDGGPQTSVRALNRFCPGGEAFCEPLSTERGERLGDLAGAKMESLSGKGGYARRSRGQVARAGGSPPFSPQEARPVGRVERHLDTSRLSNGLYFVRLTADGPVRPNALSGAVGRLASPVLRRRRRGIRAASPRSGGAIV